MIQFLATLVINYSLAKLSAPDGPRLTDSENRKGNFGAPIPRVYGSSAVRIDECEFIAFGPLKETKRKVKKNWLDNVMNIISPITNLLPQPSYYTYDRSFAILIADRTDDDPIEDLVKIWANGKVVFDASNAVGSPVETFDANGHLISRKWTKANKTHSVFDTITIYGGGFEQPVDPVVDGYVAQTQAYRGTAYASISKFQLADTGNSTPTLDVLVKPRTGESLATFVEAVCRAAGIDPERNISSTDLADQELRGYAVLQESSCWEAIRPVLPAYRDDAAEVAGQIRFFERGKVMRSVIPEKDMGGYTYGDEAPPVWTSSRAEDVGLPRQYDFTFRDPARDYQANTQFSRRTEGDANSNISASVALTLTADEGRQTAELLHWEIWSARLAKAFTLTDQWIDVAPGDVYGHPCPDGIRPHRITRKNRGANGIIEVESVSDESVVYRSSATGDSGEIPDNPVQIAGDTTLVMIDGPILSDLQDDYGFYFAIAGEGAGWRGATVERLVDGAYEELTTTSLEAVIGDVYGTLPAGPTTGLDDTVDNTTVLTVELLRDDMELESATADELETLANLALIAGETNGEIIQFTTATQIGPATWELTGLLRGRKGTDYGMAAHTTGETFVLLEPDSLMRADYGLADWNIAHDYRAVSIYQDEDEVTALAFSNTGEGKRPYSPIDVEGTWDGSNNFTITWDSRSRLNAGGLGIDDNAEWDIEITSGGGQTATVVAETWTYTAAEQTANGLTPGDSISGRVRQTSDVNDGRWRTFTFVGPLDTLHLEDDTTPLHVENGTDILELE